MRPTRDQIQERLLAYMKERGARPVLIGSATNHLGWWANLTEVEDILEELVFIGTARKLTDKESRYLGIHTGYVLVESGNLGPPET